MSAKRPSRGALGGFGALFFLGTLGVIAFYVQQQSLPQERDVVRKAATALPEVAEEETPVALPWQDRLDLAAARLVPFVSTAPAPKDDESGATAEPDTGDGADPAVPAQLDPGAGRLVQDLADGHRILLTLDPVMQDSMEQIFRNREVPYAGAVALDLRDNAVLVLAGHSSFDPEVDPLEIVTTAWSPAASTFKLVTAAALLETGKVTPTTRACFSGGLHGIDAKDLEDDSGRDTQCASLAGAIAHSHNLVIGKLARKYLDEQALRTTARKLLFEADIPFEFPIERSPAHIPADDIERAKVAAGFWNVDLSPMHAAILSSVLARDGQYQPPHIIAHVMGPDGSDLTPVAPTPDRILAKATASAVGQMMVATTEEGTARSSFRDKHGNQYIPGVTVAGKTGSLTGKRAPALNYNWFIGFAPADRPEIAFAVLLANEPKWRIKAHYAGRRLVQLYMQRRDEIARQRDAHVTTEGVQLTIRDATGSIIAGAAPGTQPGGTGKPAGKDGSAGPAPKADDPDRTAMADAPAPAPAGAPKPTPPARPDPLPPVPGPVPKVETQPGS